MAQGMLDTATALSTRKYLFKTTKLLAVISLHKDSFRPHTGVQTCVLIFEKKKKENDKVPPTHKIFMAISRKIGQDSEGLPRFKRENDGKETAELDKERSVLKLEKESQKELNEINKQHNEELKDYMTKLEHLRETHDHSTEQLNAKIIELEIELVKNKKSEKK